MNWQREEHPDQLELNAIMEAPEQKAQTNAERQKAFRERQRAMGRKYQLTYLTADERQELQNVLNCMRMYGEKPAMMRSLKTGQMRALEEF